MSPRPKNVLVVAFHFPPIAAAGTHRTLNFVRLLAERGYRIGVVAARSSAGQGVDEGLLSRVPASVRVVRSGYVDPFRVLSRLKGAATAARPARGIMPVAGDPAPGATKGPVGFRRLLDWTSRFVTLPDRYLSWVGAALLPAVRLAREVDAEVLYSTAPPYSAHLLGLLLADVLGLPWVCDLRDPWTLNPFHANPYPSLERCDSALERAVLSRARRVVLNTEPAEALYRERYPELDKFTAITNGIAPEMLDLPAGPATNGRLDLLHVGGIYGRRFPAGLLRGLERLRSTDPGVFDRVEVEQIGPGGEREQLEALARDLGISERLRTQGPVSHREALERCRVASGLLLLGPSGDAPEVQVPSKLYEYLALDRPIVALAKRGGAIASILARARPRYVLADPDDPAAIAEALVRFAAGEYETEGPRDIGRFGYPWLTDRLEEQLDLAARAGRA